MVLAAEAEDPPNPVIPEMNEIVWAAIFFVALWALMKYVLLPPIVRAMEGRNATIDGDRDAADAATAALGSTRRDYEASLAEARAEANEIIAAAIVIVAVSILLALGFLAEDLATERFGSEASWRPGLADRSEGSS